MHKAIAILLATAIAAASTGCDTILHAVSDPGSRVPTGNVLKSIRCELVTYLAVNYQRALLFNALKYNGRLDEAIDKYSYIDIDRTRFAGVTANIKEVQAASIGSPIDLKYPSLARPESDFRDFKIGPSISASRTFIKGQLFIVPQYAGIGPAKRGLDSTEQIYEAYAEQSDLDKANKFYCYKQLDFTPPPDRYGRLKDLERLSNHEYAPYEQFERIFVDGRTTLASWLTEQSQEISHNILSQDANSEGLINGQLNYSFELEYKPALEIGYTLVARTISPLNPSGSLSNDSTSTFAFFINLKQTVEANSASTGGAVLEKSLAKRIPQTP